MTRPVPSALLLALLAAAAPLPLQSAQPALPTPPDGLPPYGEDRPLPALEVRQERLPNGLEVWIVPRAGMPKLTAVLAVRGGTASDRPGRIGVSEVFAEALRQGTATRSARRIAEDLAGVGGSLATQVREDALLATADGLAHGADLVLEVLADVAHHATFPDAEVELARANALQALLAEESTPEFPADTAFAAAVFGEHPYRHVAPERAGLEAATAELLRAEHARRLRPDRSLLLLVGRLDLASAAALARRHFGDWRPAAAATGAAADAAAEVSVPAPRPPRRLLVPRPGSVQSEIRVGSLGPRETDPGYFPALVANTVVGGSFSSRLVQNIREDKGYTYGGYSSLRTFAQAGLLVQRAAVRNEVTGAALLEIFYEFDRAAVTDPTPEELSRAQRYQRGLYLLRNQTQAAQARALADLWVKGLPPEFLAEFVPRVDAVTAAQVRAAGATLFASRRQTVVVSGDPEAIRKEVAPLGEFEVVEEQRARE